MSDEKFTEKDYDRIIDDIINEYFAQHNMSYDAKELAKIEMLGEEQPLTQSIVE